jgi:hypothetical protein
MLRGGRAPQRGQCVLVELVQLLADGAHTGPRGSAKPSPNALSESGRVNPHTRPPFRRLDDVREAADNPGHSVERRSEHFRRSGRPERRITRAQERDRGGRRGPYARARQHRYR